MQIESLSGFSSLQSETRQYLVGLGLNMKIADFGQSHFTREGHENFSH
jgi:hypothetical protein